MRTFTQHKLWLKWLLVLAFLQVIMPGWSQYTIMNNSALRMGTGSENSVNSSGNLQQPFYYNNTTGWRQLTFSNYPLDNAFAIDGVGTNEWNVNGTISANPSLSSQTIDKTGFKDTTYTIGGTSVNGGYGTIVSKGTITIGGKTLEIENTYKLPKGKSYMEVKVKVKNTTASQIDNVRIWVGTRDDYVGGTDQPTKQKGNLVDGAFVKNTSVTDRSLAIKIFTSEEGVLFYTKSTKGNTIVSSCCQWTNITSKDPTSSSLEVTNDGSYGFYVRFNDLPAGESDEFTWYYAAGELANLENIINDVAQASGAIANITQTGAEFKATSTADAMGYWMVVPRNSTAPTAAQVKAGVNYGSVTITASGSGHMTANVEKVFPLTGVIAGTPYDLYFITEDDASLVLSVPVKTQFATIPNAPPTVTTADASSITKITATSGGDVTADGGLSVTARGVCWNTSGTPSITDNKTSDGTGTGTYTSSITGLSPGTTYYVSAYATNTEGTGYGAVKSFTALKEDQSITFNSLTTKVFGDADFDPGATASSSLGVSYSSATSAVATIVSGKIHIVGAGTSVITASQTGNSTYNAATNVQQTLTVNKADQTITFSSLSAKVYGNADFNPGATSGSGLTIAYSSSNTSVATIVSGQIHIVGTGSSVITASQTGNTNYNAADDVQQTLNVDKASQTITFSALAAKIYNDPDFALTASSNSGLAISYNSSDPSVATVESGQVHLVGIGTTIITASQAGDNNYNVAEDVQQNLVVNKATPSIVWDNPVSIEYGIKLDATQLNAASTVEGTFTYNPDINALLNAGNDQDLTVNFVPVNEAIYNSTSKVVKISVNKKSLSIKADNKYKVFGHANPAFTFTYNGFIDSESQTELTTLPSAITVADETSVAGVYDIVPSGAVSGNYDFIYENGVLRITNLAGDKDGDGTITSPEVAGDNDCDGNITTPEITGDKDGDGTITSPELAGDKNGDGFITSPEICGDVNGDGTITSPEFAGDKDGDGTVDSDEKVGDSNGDGTISSPELAGDKNGDGSITSPEICGDVNGDGTITSPEFAGDKDGDGTVDSDEKIGDNNGDGTISSPELAGDKNGDGNITSPEVCGDVNGDGTITIPEFAGDKDGDGTVDDGEKVGDNNGDGTITAPEIAGDKNGDGTITSPEVCGDVNGDGTITNPEFAGDKDGDGTVDDGEKVGDSNGDGTITSPELAGDKNGDGSITSPEICGDVNGDGTITSPEFAGDKDGDGNVDSDEKVGDNNGDGTISSPELAGDKNGDGSITSPEICGDVNGDGTIASPEFAGDKDGDGTVDSDEKVGDSNGDGTISSPELAGDKNGDGSITSPEVCGDVNGDGTITSPEFAGDKDGDGTVDSDEKVGDSNGDGTISSPELAGDKNGDGSITDPEICGDVNGDGTITSPEFAGDKDGDGTVDAGEKVGDKDGDGTITTPEIAGDKNGDGTITSPEVCGDVNGDGTITNPEFAGDKDGDGTVDPSEKVGDKDGDGTISSPELAGDKNGDGSIASPEICGDVNGDGTITSPEFAGDKDGDGTVDDGEKVGDSNGDGTISSPELAGDKNGDGSITSPEVCGDVNGDGTITSPEFAGDKDGDGTVDSDEKVGDNNGDGAITAPEIAGDKNGDGTITDPEICGDVNGDGAIVSPELTGDVNGDGEIESPEILGDTNGNNQIDATEVAGDTNGDGKINNNEVRVIDPAKDHKNVDQLFSPNADGVNDYWKLPEIEKYGQVKVKIYNRWGGLVYESTNYQNDWDGTSDGKPIPEGAYFYFVKTEKDGDKTGVVNIVR